MVERLMGKYERMKGKYEANANRKRKKKNPTALFEAQ